MKQQLISLYTRRFGHAPERIHDLRADGSDRKIYRLVDAAGATAVGVFGPDQEENRAFLSYSRALRDAGLSVPEIYDADEAAQIYLEEDLGDTTLFDALVTARGQEVGFPDAMVPVYERVVETLPRFQVEGGRAIDFSVAYPYAEFDRQSIMWDLNYFKYHFLKLAKISFNESRLERDFIRFIDLLLRADRSHFLYRDFQSRNIMLREGDLWFIDYQGGRRGALQYDIASLLYDAKAALPQSLRAMLLERYLDALEDHVTVDRGEFVELYRGYVLVRIMQAMGAYGYRGFFEGKTHFLASVPYAVRNIEAILADGLPVDLPELRAIFERIVARDFEAEIRRSIERHGGATNGGTEPSASPVNGTRRERVPASHANEQTPLHVHIRSFSFRHGYPEDATGHGGGFVFDCRALHNPGRYDEYRGLCGCDAPVAEFLERDEEVETFFGAVRALIDGAVRNYLDRGFSDLTVSFGCTGGQHRSVYFAERLAAHLRDTFPSIHLEVTHREQQRWPATAGVSE